MITLQQKFQNVTCSFDGHKNSSIVSICTHHLCKCENRAVCFYCQKDHDDHQSSLISIDKIPNLIQNHPNNTELSQFENFKNQIQFQLKELEQKINNNAPQDILEQINQKEVLSLQEINQMGAMLSQQRAVDKIKQKIEDKKQAIINRMTQDTESVASQDNVENEPKLTLNFFQSMISKHQCTVSGHEGNNLILLCFSLQCLRKNPGVCGLCFQNHKGHKMVSVAQINLFLNSHLNQNNRIQFLTTYQTQQEEIIQKMKEMEQELTIELQIPLHFLKGLFANPQNQQLQVLAQGLASQFRIQKDQISHSKIDFDKYFQLISKAAELVKQASEIVAQCLHLKFSKNLKYADIEVEQVSFSMVKLKISQTNKSLNYVLCTCEHSIPTTQISRFVFILLITFQLANQNHQQWIKQQNDYRFNRSGIMQKIEVRIKKKYRFQNFRFELSKQGKQDKGVYILSSDGFAYEQSKEKVQSNVQFRTDDILDCIIKYS